MTDAPTPREVLALDDVAETVRILQHYEHGMLIDGNELMARLRDRAALTRREPLDVERLAKMLGDWVRIRNETCDEPSPCDHDRMVARAILEADARLAAAE